MKNLEICHRQQLWYFQCKCSFFSTRLPFVDSKKERNYFRFPVHEDNSDGNISVQNVDGDEDDSLNDEEQ